MSDGHLDLNRSYGYLATLRAALFRKAQQAGAATKEMKPRRPVQRKSRTSAGALTGFSKRGTLA